MEDKALTKMVYDQIFERLANRAVQPPVYLTMETLTAWLNGYSRCQDDILEIIEDLKDQYGR